MTALMQVDRDRKSARLHLIVDAHAVFGHHVVVVEPVREQHRRLDVLHEGQQIARVPEIIHVAGRTILSFRSGEDPVLPDPVAVRATRGIAAGDEIIEDVDVLAEVAARRANESVGAIVVVVRRVRRHGNDDLESLHARRRRRERKRAFIRRADHSDFACRPRRGCHFFISQRSRESPCATVEPIDHEPHCLALGVVADRRAALRQARAARLGVYDGEAARHPFVDEGVGDAVPIRLICGRVHFAARLRLGAQLLLHFPIDLILRGPGVIRTGSVDDGNLQSFRFGLRGASDVDVYPVLPAVVVGVEVGLHPEVVADPLR